MVLPPKRSRARLKNNDQGDQANFNGFTDDIVEGGEIQCVGNVTQHQQKDHSLDNLGSAAGFCQIQDLVDQKCDDKNIQNICGKVDDRYDT